MRKIISVFLSAILCMTAVTAFAQADEPKAGGILQIGVTQLTTNVGYSPDQSSNSIMKFARSAYNSLLNYDPAGVLIGELATAWEQDAQAKTITYHLRDGVVFSDGTPFNAEAVKWNIEQYVAFGRTEVAGIASIECPDDLTVVITLDTWNGSKLESIGFFVYYMSPAAIEANGKDWAYTNTCGTGPFVLETIVEGSSIAYAKNPLYWEAGKPYLDGVKFNYFADSTTLSYALQNKEIDMVFDTPAAVVLEYQNADGYYISKNANGQGYESLGVIADNASEYHADGSVNPFYYPLVRKALNYALDKDALCEIMTEGLGTPTNQWATQDASTYSPNVVANEYNPEKAKELLAEAGFADGFTTTIYNVSGYFDDACALIQAYLADVGITVNIQNEDVTTLTGRMYNGWEGLYWHWATITPDLGLYMGRHLDPAGAYYAGYIQHPDDAVALLNSIRTASTPEEKQSLSWQLQELIYNDYALFGSVIYTNCIKMVCSDYVKDGGFGASHASVWSPANCWLDK